METIVDNVDRTTEICILQAMNTEQVLTRLNIDPTCRIKAVQQVRELVEGSPNPLAAAKVLFTNLADPSAEFKFTDSNEARLTVALLVEDAIKLGEQYDPNNALERAAKWIVSHRQNNPWSFYKPETSIPTETVHREGVNVEVKQNGALKKGSKQILTAALYEKHKALSNKEIIEIFIKEVGMTVGGARTYLYNLRKAAK